MRIDLEDEVGLIVRIESGVFWSKGIEEIEGVFVPLPRSCVEHLLGEEPEFNPMQDLEWELGDSEIGHLVNQALRYQGELDFLCYDTGHSLERFSNGFLPCVIQEYNYSFPGVLRNLAYQKAVLVYPGEI